MPRLTRATLPAAATLVLGLAACGGSESSASLTDPDSGALERVKSAVVRIEAEGSFADPGETAQSTRAGSGSGFVIDASGLAVTNNHVVSGAALLRAHVGEEDEPRNARVLGRSECSDLAVIQIEGGGDFTHLDWEAGRPEVGTEVFAAGFPLGDEEFSLTRGIVSKAETDGETPWASVDATLEHDATINPGSSGGPLLSESGTVIGVNYASRPDASQYFAISEAEAQKIVTSLAEGEDVTAVGINARAVLDSETGRSGVWVSSVTSGSAADDVGLKPGDIILRLESLPVGENGSLEDYCDIIRSRDASEQIAIQVLRPGADQVLEGRLNGEELTPSFSFAEQAAEDAVPAQGSSGASAYATFRRVSDQTGAITLEIPVEWRDINGRPADFGPSILASSNLVASDDLRAAGVAVVATKRAGRGQVETVLGAVDGEVRGKCGASTDSREYRRGRFEGRFRVYTDCGPNRDAAAVVVSATPASGDYLVVIGLQATSRRDLEALDGVLDTIGVRPSRF